MSIINRMRSNKGQEDVFWVRTFISVGAIVYPLWSLFFRYALPGAYDSIYIRGMLSVFGVFVIIATFINRLRAHVLGLLYLTIIVATGQQIYMSVLNKFHPYYQMGTIVLIAVLMPLFQSVRTMMLYIVVTTLMALIPLAYYDLRSLAIFYAGGLTFFFISGVVLYSRLSLLKKLQSSREIIATEADKVEAINRDISSIMQNIHQGIFTIESSDGAIGPHYSHYLETILAFQPSKQSQFLDLFARSNLTSDQKDQMSAAIGAIGEELLQFELNSGLLPQNCELTRADGQYRSIELEWNPILLAHTETITKILVTVRDVTDYNELLQTNRSRQEELRNISDLISVDEKKLDSVYGSLRKLQDNINTLLKSRDILEPEHLRRLFRELHTIKGLARSYHLSSLAESAHNCESQLSHLKSQNSQVESAMILGVVKPVESILRGYGEIIFKKLGRSRQTESRLSIERGSLLSVLEKLNSKVSPNLESSKSVREASAELLSMVSYPLERVLEDVIASCEEIAANLQKPRPMIIVHDPGLSFTPACHDLLKNVFTHLLRNSMDHGIEAPKDRVQKGKPELGRVDISLVQSENDLQIEIKDDGAGLDIQKIFAKACRLNLLAATQQPPTDVLANLIFLPDFSTKDEVTTVSGRGIGMDAVRVYLEAFDCQIKLKLHNEKDGFADFSIQIRVPGSFMESYVGFGGAYPSCNRL
jgi:HPt (histidine-containing phosphotransfer) domain-containing protein